MEQEGNEGGLAGRRDARELRVVLVDLRVQHSQRLGAGVECAAGRQLGVVGVELVAEGFPGAVMQFA